MLYEAKEGTKAYEYIKGIVEAELQERVNYKKRIVEAIGSDFDKDIHVENNRLLSRRFRIEKILVNEDEDFELDISEESFSQYVLTLSKRFRKLGNIHSGIGFLMEEDNKEEEK